jgi:hypothetical protein
MVSDRAGSAKTNASGAYTINGIPFGQYVLRVDYPKAPDMRRVETQRLTDGEFYYIIHNGVRLTGMPAWGGKNVNDFDS